MTIFLGCKMKRTIASLALAASLVTPTIAYAAPAGHGFVAPGPNDVRSPCPGLNTLANHAFLPHDGMNISLEDLITGLAEGLNVGADFATLIGALALTASPNPLGGTFDLSDIDEHNFPIEHDGSLSRQDFYNGDNHSFYPPGWDTVLSFFDGLTTVSKEAAALARHARVSHSNQTNPTFTYGLQQLVLSYGETALYMQTMSDPITGNAPVAYVRSLFEHERLPYELGWQPSTLPTTLASLGAFIVELNAISPDPIAEDTYVVANTYKNVLDGIAALAGVRNPTLGG